MSAMDKKLREEASMEEENEGERKWQGKMKQDFENFCLNEEVDNFAKTL